MTSTLLSKARKEGNPLIEGRTATLVWKGKKAPDLIGDFNNWGEAGKYTAERAGSDVWRFDLSLPSDAYVEYCFLFGEERVPDPFNKRKTPNGMGKTNNYFYMPKGIRNPLSIRKKSVPEGRLTTHHVSSDFILSGAPRPVYLYAPMVPEPYSLVVVWDGHDYYHRVHLPVIIDNLIASKRIRPIALAMVQNAGKARELEYDCNEALLKFVLDQVLPLAARELNLIDIRRNKGAFGVAGASMGGLAAMHAGVRLPEIFGRVLSQSGAFFATGEHSLLQTLLTLQPKMPLKIWMDVGRYDFLLNANRHFHKFLNDNGYSHQYHEYSGGHNSPAWRDDIHKGLEYLFPPT